MGKIYSVQVGTDFGDKEIAVFQDDIVFFNQRIDVLTTSAFVGSYEPVPGTTHSGTAAFPFRSWRFRRRWI